jgi:tRNA(fMet)-specific endonuclease VapC
MLVLDTTAVSQIMHRKPEALDRLRDLKPRDVVLSAPVLAEIRFGLERLDPGSRRRRLLETEFERLHAVIAWADWDEQSAERFGSLKAELQSRGTPIDDMDLVIASTALSLGAGVATSNVRHFERIPGLSVQVWD